MPAGMARKDGGDSERASLGAAYLQSAARPLGRSVPVSQELAKALSRSVPVSAVLAAISGARADLLTP